MKLKIGKEEIVETDELTLETLGQLQDKIIEEHDRVKATVLAVQADGRRGNYADPQRYSGLMLARTELARARQQLQDEIASRKRKAMREKDVKSELPNFFMEVAKERISDRLYEQILEEAARRYKNTRMGAKENANYVFEVGE